MTDELKMSRLITSLLLAVVCLVLAMAAVPDAMLRRPLGWFLAAMVGLFSFVQGTRVGKNAKPGKELNLLYLARGIVIVTIPLAYFLAGSWDRYEGIVLASGAPSPIVQNGSAYGKAALNMEYSPILIIPENATIEFSLKDEKKIEIYMEKTLNYSGHPKDRMSIRTMRNSLGVACRNKDGRVILATFGEWEKSEGGASVKLLIKAPKSKSFLVEKNINPEVKLFGPESIGREADGNTPEAEAEIWTNPISPKSTWQAIPWLIDRKMTAKEE